MQESLWSKEAYSALGKARQCAAWPLVQQNTSRDSQSTAPGTLCRKSELYDYTQSCRYSQSGWRVYLSFDFRSCIKNCPKESQIESRNTGKHSPHTGIVEDVSSPEGRGFESEYMFATASSWYLGGFFHFLAPVLLLYSYTFPDTERENRQVNYNELAKHLFII